MRKVLLALGLVFVVVVSINIQNSIPTQVHASGGPFKWIMKKIPKLEQRLTGVENENDTQNGIIETLENNQSDMQNEITDKEARIRALEQQVTQLMNQYRSILKQSKQ